MRIGLIVGGFPAITDPWAVQQAAALAERGHQVVVCAVRRFDEYAEYFPEFSACGFDRSMRTFPDTTQPRGSSRVLRAAARALVRHPRRCGPIILWETFTPRPHIGLSVLQRLANLVPFLSEARFDVIHAHFAPNALRILPALQAGLLRAPLLTTFHGYDANSFPGRYGHNVYRNLFDIGDRFTVGTAFMARRVLDLGCSPDKLVQIPMGIELSSFPFATRSRERGEPIQILSVARLVEVKGLEYGIRAFAAIAQNHTNLRYVIAGDGPLRAELEQLAHTLGMAERIHFLGTQSPRQSHALYRSSHLFLHSGIVSKTGAVESQSIVLAEAQASGLPVVASRIGGIPEVVIEGESAILVPTGDVKALSGQLESLVNRPNRWPTMGRAGRAFVEREFSSATMIRRLLSVYEELL